MRETKTCRSMLIQHVDKVIKYLEDTNADTSAISSALLIKDTSEILVSNIKYCVNEIVK